ncbi:hypothetical protein ACFXPQ_12435 [Streptomyces lydicus]|uniref:hypothetical protein n=1 Tax=Streptomyces lydicus TaxID=47763 RepID=UPI0036D17138
MDQRNASRTPPTGPAWAGWLYLGLAVLAGTQLLATLLQSGADDPSFVPSLVGVIAFPALAGVSETARGLRNRQGGSCP